MVETEDPEVSRDEELDWRFEWPALILPPFWFGYYGMHRRAALTLAVLVALEIGTELFVWLLVAFVEPLRAFFQGLIAQDQPNLFWVVLFAWAVWCGLYATRWRQRESSLAESDRSIASGIGWSAVTGVVLTLTFAGLVAVHIVVSLSSMWVGPQ